MEPVYVQDKCFDKVDFTLKDLAVMGNHFEDCHFLQCNFSKSVLSHLRFFDCSFVNCQLNLCMIEETLWQQVRFKGCKMMGLYFEQANRFGWDVFFDDCQLDHSSFCQMKLSSQSFLLCSLKGVDFSQAVLTGVLFSNCNLENAKFVGCDLQKADFSTAYNYSLDPEQNKLRKAKFSREGLSGLLTKYQIITM